MTGVGGSIQLRRYRIARRDGASPEVAAEAAGIPLGEALLIDADDAREPPPPEAFELIAPLAGNASTMTTETTMARRKPTEKVEQIHKPDFALAVRIYREDIKPAQARVGEFAQEQSTAYKAIKKQAHIQPQAAKLAFKLDQMEESKRDDFLRCLRGTLIELRIFMPSDLVDAAEGNGAAGGEVIPTAERARPKLATVGGTQHPSDDSDLAGGTTTEPVGMFAIRLMSVDEWLAPNEEDWLADRADAGNWPKDRAEAIRADFDDPSDVELVEAEPAEEATDHQQAAE